MTAYWNTWVDDYAPINVKPERGGPRHMLGHLTFQNNFGQNIRRPYLDSLQIL